jgi:hypothetical protein
MEERVNLKKKKNNKNEKENKINYLIGTTGYSEFNFIERSTQKTPIELICIVYYLESPYKNANQPNPPYQLLQSLFLFSLWSLLGVCECVYAFNCSAFQDPFSSLVL